MPKYIALLRGINVGGHRKVKMKALRALFGSMGFKNVATYIQSGNVVFDAPKTEVNRLSNTIKQQIEDQFGYDVPVIVRTAANLEKVLKNMPFEKQEGWKRYITFLSEEPDESHKQKLEAQSSNIEIFKLGNKVVYAQVDKQTSAKPKFSSNFIQQQLNIPATNRNLRTINKILDLAFADS
ncbi:DUF1697 domain-containing protein [Fodinibius salsisoli]|uniref:DUF1697 domain-containing protein n=1 Tax=Fodinibius salsisoli TaxID=2820877 RepID=A0ABT3PK69_9BACT|nr:DUF1697 domain-containing protein [Fodinibius salsisoli]MCW9705579.1 DUF1697 domain-containing protein [Fodinibius salsisoli]